MDGGGGEVGGRTWHRSAGSGLMIHTQQELPGPIPGRGEAPSVSHSHRTNSQTEQKASQDALTSSRTTIWTQNDLTDRTESPHKRPSHPLRPLSGPHRTTSQTEQKALIRRPHTLLDHPLVLTERPHRQNRKPSQDTLTPS